MKKDSGFSSLLVLNFIILFSIVLLVIIQQTNKRPFLNQISKLGNTPSEEAKMLENDKIRTTENTLETLELQTGEIKVTDTLNNIEFIVPVTYNLVGTGADYTVSFSGSDSNMGPGAGDFSQLQFRQIEYDGKLYDEVMRSFKLRKENEGRSVDYSDIKEIRIGEINAYYYDCPFLVYQACIYVPSKENTEKYLFILKSFQDGNDRGYERELDQILRTVKYSE